MLIMLIWIGLNFGSSSQTLHKICLQSSTEGSTGEFSNSNDGLPCPVETLPPGAACLGENHQIGENQQK